MKNLLWDSKYSVGHERIDHEHQVFLDLIRNASRASDENAPKERVLRLLTEVRKYAEFHFYSEENIMIDCGYPDYPAHHEEHRVLLANLDDELYHYRRGSHTLAQVVDYLFQWFALHTTGSDKVLAKYINKACS